jgi:hypothetical protein
MAPGFKHPLTVAYKHHKDKTSELYLAATGPCGADVCIVCGTSTPVTAPRANQAWRHVTGDQLSGYFCGGVLIPEINSKYADLMAELEQAWLHEHKEPLPDEERRSWTMLCCDNCRTRLKKQARDAATAEAARMAALAEHGAAVPFVGSEGQQGSQHGMPAAGHVQPSPEDVIRAVELRSAERNQVTRTRLQAREQEYREAGMRMGVMQASRRVHGVHAWPADEAAVRLFFDVIIAKKMHR